MFTFEYKRVVVYVNENILKKNDSMAQLALDKYRKREYSNNMMMKGTEMQVFLTFCEENFLEAFATEELAQRFIECMSEENGGNYYYFATEVLER